jgi:hypothetical protein
MSDRCLLYPQKRTLISERDAKVVVLSVLLWTAMQSRNVFFNRMSVVARLHSLYFVGNTDSALRQYLIAGILKFIVFRCPPYPR